MIDILKLTQLMAQSGIAKPSDLIGVSSEEIRKMESDLGLQFPTAYRAYLRSFGRSAGLLTPWMAIYFDDLKEIRAEFRAQNAELSRPLKLPDNALLVAHCEQVFDLIPCGKNEDPPVYRTDLASENGIMPTQQAEHFSDYLEQLIYNSQRVEFPLDPLDELDIPNEDLIRYP